MNNTASKKTIEYSNLFEVLERLFLFVQDKPGMEKISFNSIEPGVHYTIRFWSRKKTIDLHKTNELTGAHETCFEISTFKLLLLLRRLGIVNEFLIKEIWLSRKINVGKLKKNACWLVAVDGVNSTYPELLNVKKRRLRFRKGLSVSIMMESLEFISPDLLANCPEGLYVVYKFKGGNFLHQGLLFKMKSPGGNYFVTQRDFNLTSKLMMIALYNLTTRISFEKKDEVLIQLKQLLLKKYPYLKWISA